MAVPSFVDSAPLAPLFEGRKRSFLKVSRTRPRPQRRVAEVVKDLARDGVIVGWRENGLGVVPLRAAGALRRSRPPRATRIMATAPT